MTAARPSASWTSRPGRLGCRPAVSQRLAHGIIVVSRPGAFLGRVAVHERDGEPLPELAIPSPRGTCFAPLSHHLLPPSSTTEGTMSTLYLFLEGLVALSTVAM